MQVRFGDPANIGQSSGMHARAPCKWRKEERGRHVGHHPQDDDLLAAQATGRRKETAISTQDGSRIIIVAKVYGHADNSNDPSAKRATEAILKLATSALPPSRRLLTFLPATSTSIPRAPPGWRRRLPEG